MLREHKPMCSLEWSYAESHQGTPASESRTSMKPQTRVKFPLTTCISGFLTSPHVLCTTPRAGSPKGGGAVRLPQRAHTRRARRAPVWGTTGAPRARFRGSTTRGLCALPSEQRCGCLPGCPSDPHEGGARPHGGGPCGKALAGRMAFPRETGGDELEFLTRDLTTNMVCSKSFCFLGR